jgi:acyl-CoA thioesterase I
MKRILLLLFTIGTSPVMMSQTSLRYVALGDSYTICTGATEENSWPVLLTQHLVKNKMNVELVANPSRNGWTSQDLIDRELPVFERSSASFVTILIGVNDWVQGVSESTFKKNLTYILDRVQAKLPDKNKVVLITIPDFSVTPSGKHFGNGRNVTEGIATFNKLIKEEAEKRKLGLVDLFEVSKQMGKDSSLVSDDELHPSAKEYAIWETLIYPAVYQVLKK